MFMQNLEQAEAAERMTKALLDDASTLLGCRWQMDFQQITIDSQIYIFGTQTRFTVSNATIRVALGELADHVEFLRGTSHNTAEELARFQKCKKKWKVPDLTTESSSGWGGSEQGETSTFTKRRRY